MPQAVDVDLFVNAASKGFNDGAKVASPWASFFEGLFDGAKWAQDYRTQELQNQQRQIEIDQAPLRTEILEAQAAQAGITADVINENPDTFKAAAIAEAKAKTAEAERIVIYESKKRKLSDLLSSGDTVAMGEAYLDPQNQEVFAKDQSLNNGFKNSYSGWREETQQLYQERERKNREVALNTKIAETMQLNNAKFQADYLGNQELNGYKATLGNISDTDFLEKGTIIYDLRPPEMAAMQPKIDPNTGQPLKNAKGATIPGNTPVITESGKLETSYNWKAPPDQWKRVPLLMYEGKEVGILTPEAVKDFNNYRSTYNYLNNLNKGQDGTTTLADRAKQEKIIREAKEAAAQTRASEEAQKAASSAQAFLEGSKVSTQFAGSADKVKASIESSVAPPAATNQVPQSNETVPGRVSSSAVISTPSSNLTPGQVQAFNTVSALNRAGQPTELVKNAQTGSHDIKPSWVKNIEARQQLAAAKASEKLKRYQQANKPAPAAPIPPAEQARATVSSSFVPENVEVRSPYVSSIDQNAILRVAKTPELAGLSALAKAVAVQESGGRNDAISPTGVEGVMQVTKATADSIIPDSDRADPLQSMILGSIYLEQMMANPSFRNNPMLALTAYNGGPAIAQEAVRLAGTTDWSIVKDYIEQAVLSPKFTAQWRKLKIDPKQKAREVREYAEKVVINVPAFLYSRQDMEVANALKAQGVLVF